MYSETSFGINLSTRFPLAISLRIFDEEIAGRDTVEVKIDLFNLLLYKKVPF